jgi:energy-coupling factor transporter ATP-binding protein EcfA2
VDVLAEILTWSKDCPDWQRDALRRLVLNRDLDETDIDSLTEICKTAHGLANEQNVIPLGKEHLPASGPNTGRVNVHSIYHKCGVNALAENQTLNFGPGLTVVYGDNAAGKSGYTRIFKSACRARGAEDILGNVLSGAAPLTPSVSIKFTVGDGPMKEWPSGGEHESLARVSVFDRHSEAVYTTQKTDVAFRPFGLDLFDKLSKACAAVRARLEREQRSLGASLLQTLTLPENTAAAKFVARLSSLTKPEEVRALGTLSDEQNERLALLDKQLLDLKANDPAKTRQELVLRTGRLRTLVQHAGRIEASLSHESVRSVFEAQKDLSTKRDQAASLRQHAFPAGLLMGTGSDSWSQMWESARRFSEGSAYPDRPFPVTLDARCVLCQQDLDQDAAARLSHFEGFIVSAAEKDLRTARETYTRLLQGINDLQIVDSATQQTLSDVRIESESLADETGANLSSAEQRRTAIIEALKIETGLPADLPALLPVTKKLDALAEQLNERAKSLQTGASEAQKKALSGELQELKARQMFGKHEQSVLDEIERKSKVAAYGMCLDDTRTQPITMKSTAVTKVAITQQLKKTFKDELKNLKFRHVEVELTEAGGESGSLYHKLILTRAPGVDLPKVVSEGEARCLSIAAFFAELSTADDPSAILFDDPVSSFDYKWRESVAQRLVEEARTRQVIVFTHDIVFLLLLQQYADQQGVDRLDQHVRQLQIGAGVCDPELPWVALPVKKRVGFLKKLWQEADKLFRNGHQSAYEKDAAYIYGLLREAWERGLEEVLLGGTVERYRAGVQTQQIEQLADITIEDCKALDSAMTKCSKWLPGHDQAPAARQDIPAPDELKTDIEALDTWVATIRKRRQA